jgi:hypothetical protein
MPTRKMRVELFDGEGNKYMISFEGQITREKALRLLDLVELLGGMPGGGGPRADLPIAGNESSKYEKTQSVIQKHFPVVWFYSREVQSVYEQELKEPIGISTVATYLGRMANKGILLKTGASNRLKYRVSATISQATLKQQTT